MLSEMDSKIKLKRGQIIQYSLDGTDDVVTAKVLGRGRKSTGKYKNSYNAEYRAPENLKGTHAYIDLDRVTNFKLIVNISEMYLSLLNLLLKRFLKQRMWTFLKQKWFNCKVGKLMKSIKEVSYENQKCISV